MSEKKYNITAVDINMRFDSFEILPIGKKIDGKMFGFPGVNVMIVECAAEQFFIGGDMIYHYEAKVTK